MGKPVGMTADDFKTALRKRLRYLEVNNLAYSMGIQLLTPFRWKPTYANTTH
jgi:hypothetical protein